MWVPKGSRKASCSISYILNVYICRNIFICVCPHTCFPHMSFHIAHTSFIYSLYIHILGLKAPTCPNIGTIISIAYDKVDASTLPAKWNLSSLYVSVWLGSTISLLHFSEARMAYINFGIWRGGRTFKKQYNRHSAGP